MNLLKFPHSAMFVGVIAYRKTEFLLKLLETVYKNHCDFMSNNFGQQNIPF